MKSPTAFVMSWNIQYLGSYPVHKISSESLQRRMDKVSDVLPQFVYLSISLNGVYVATEDKPKSPFLAHSIRRICCVVGSKETRQVAYVTKRQGEDGKSKKECHIFRTEVSQQVEEVKSVLSSAFQRIVFVDNSTPATPFGTLSSRLSAASQTNSDTTISSPRSTSLPRLPSPKQPPQLQSDWEVHTPSGLPYTSTPVSRRRQMSAAILFHRFFGGTPKGSSDTTPKMRKHKDPERKRKRPVSEVFGQAMRHAANTLTPKRTVSKPGLCGTPAVMLRDKMALARIHETVAENEPTSTALKKEPTLEFDEKLGEFVYPIGDFMDDQLQRLAYFCSNPNKYEVYGVLTQMPEGAFILRYSESRHRCLALSMRVPDTEEKEGNNIAHYLIIKNDKGFRLKGSPRFFASLPMLITHHTILPEILPCRLIFVEWDRNLVKAQPLQPSVTYNPYETRTYSSPRIMNLSQSPLKKLARRSLELFES